MPRRRAYPIYKTLTPEVRTCGQAWREVHGSEVRATRDVTVRFRVYDVPGLGLAVAVQDTWLNMRSSCVLFQALDFLEWARSEDFGAAARVEFSADGIRSDWGRKPNHFVKVEIGPRKTSVSPWYFSTWRSSFVFAVDNLLARGVLET